MLAVLSPAKKLNFDSVPEGTLATLPEYQQDANRLSRIAKKLSVSELRGLMNISEDLAILNRDRFKMFAKESTHKNAKQAMLAFAGDTYLGLFAGDFDAADQEYAQDNLRILSGLYGVLRPMDLMQPYRLEMGSRLANKQGPSLYAYWGTKIAHALDEASGGAPVVNLASTEYFRAANSKAMKSPVISTAFKEEKNGELKMIGFFAKRARGAMARYMIKNRVDQMDGLKSFNLDGYGFRSDLSGETELVFTRNSV